MNNINFIISKLRDYETTESGFTVLTEDEIEALLSFFHQNKKHTREIKRELANNTRFLFSIIKIHMNLLEPCPNIRKKVLEFENCVVHTHCNQCRKGLEERCRFLNSYYRRESLYHNEIAKLNEQLWSIEKSLLQIIKKMR